MLERTLQNEPIYSIPHLGRLIQIGRVHAARGSHLLQVRALGAAAPHKVEMMVQHVPQVDGKDDAAQDEGCAVVDHMLQGVRYGGAVHKHLGSR